MHRVGRGCVPEALNLLLQTGIVSQQRCSIDYRLSGDDLDVLPTNNCSKNQGQAIFATSMCSTLCHVCPILEVGQYDIRASRREGDDIACLPAFIILIIKNSGDIPVEPNV